MLIFCFKWIYDKNKNISMSQNYQSIAEKNN